MDVQSETTDERHTGTSSVGEDSDKEVDILISQSDILLLRKVEIIRLRHTIRSHMH